MESLLSKEEIEYADTFLVQLVESRGLNGTQLHLLSGVSQPTVSRVLTRTQPASRDVLERKTLPSSRCSSGRCYSFRCCDFEVFERLPSLTFALLRG